MSDVFCGFLAGCSQVAVGYPLDTIKVLIQNNQSWRTTNPLSLYRGCAYPLMSSVFFNSIAFTVFERTISYTNNNFLSGFCSGLCVSPILFLFDIGKIKRQTRQTVGVRDIVKTRGYPITCARETIAMSIYFGVYKMCVEQYHLHPLIAGGISGISNWTVTYPLDILKTRQMARNCSIKEAYALPGSMWKGYPVCAVRAIIVNATIFYVYDKSRSFFKKEGQKRKEWDEF